MKRTVKVKMEYKNLTGSVEKIANLKMNQNVTLAVKKSAINVTLMGQNVLKIAKMQKTLLELNAVQNVIKKKLSVRIVVKH